jgi:hypothetical protein
LMRDNQGRPVTAAYDETTSKRAADDENGF